VSDRESDRKRERQRRERERERERERKGVCVRVCACVCESSLRRGRACLCVGERNPFCSESPAIWTEAERDDLPAGGGLSAGESISTLGRQMRIDTFVPS
jgi:hypothetical protein